MMFTEEQVEWIVVEVIRRLGLFKGNERSAVTERSSITPDLVLSEKVITLRLLEGRLTGIARVVVPRKAVVTPAVKDELNARRIVLVTE